MKTEDLIRRLNFAGLPPTVGIKKEIIKRLEELEGLKRLSYRAFKLLEEIVHL